LKPAQGNSSRDPIYEEPFKKRAGGVAQGVGPKFKPQYYKKKKKGKKRDDSDSLRMFFLK
jgi:hypothetical protein